VKAALSASVIQRGKSGVATYIGGLLRGMGARGWPCEIAVFGLEGDRAWFEPWLDRCEFIPVPESARPAVKNILWHQTRLPSLLRKHGCNLLHIPSYRRIVAAPGVPQVVTIHDLAPFRLAGKYDALRMFYGRQVVKRLARRAAEIIAVSRTTADDVRTFFAVDPARLTVVYNGIDHGRFRPLDRESVPARLPVTAGWTGGWWIYVARLEHPAKNHLRLIAAYEQLCERAPGEAGHLVLAGADWHGADVIHAAIARSPVRDRIHCAGFVADDDLPAWYAGARALVFPSLFEGFGLPPIEAMACGCPVLSSDRGSLREVVGDAAHIFDPEDTTAIAGAMIGLAENPAEQDELRRLGFARAAQFRWERCADETISLYRRALRC
jgi:glycosyltransferase involved in cell wall biosynthesis